MTRGRGGGGTGPGDKRPVCAITLRPPELIDRLLGDASWDRLSAVVQVERGSVLTELSSPAARERLRDVEVLITGWGCDPLDDAVLDAAPALRGIVHAGGTLSGQLGPHAARRGIAVSNAGAANAIPVAEFTVAMIVLANKATFRLQRHYREHQAPLERFGDLADIGNHGRTVGIVSASRIGRMVIDRLGAFDLEVVVHDPTLTAEDADAIGARVVGLDELLHTSDVVSLHPPVLPSTIGMIGARELTLLRDGATLINTSRGVIVDQEALVAELVSGRIEAIIDVTEPDVLPAGHPLFTLPNVLLTPHIAGSMGRELHRLGAHVVDEVARFAAGQPFAHPELTALDP